jgi:hypothetical protein
MSCDPTERVCAGLHMARTRKDVADQLAVLIAKTKAGLPLAVESWTLERFAEHWLTHVVGPRLRPSTFRAIGRRCVCTSFRRLAVRIFAR